MPKSIAKNSVYNIIYKSINVAFPLITAAYVSRILMAEGIGKVATSQNIVQYFFLVAALGLPTYGVKAIASAKNRKELNATFSELFIVNCISTAICTILYYSMIYALPAFNERILLFAISGIKIPFNIINIDWLYQGKEEYRYIMIRNIIVKLILFALIFVFVKTSEDYITYALILVLATGINYIFNIVHSRKFVSFTTNNLKIRRHLKPVFALLAASISIEVYTLADTTLLSFIKGDVIVGYYSQSIKAINVIKSLVTAICAVFLPRLSYYNSIGDKERFNKLAESGIKILLFISIPATIGVICLAHQIVFLLFGSDFYNSILSTRILSISIISCALSNFIGYQILVTIGKERQMLLSTILGAVTNVVLNIFFINLWSHNGAAIASVITEMIVTICQFLVIKELVPIKIEKKFFGSLFLSNFIMFCVILICLNFFENYLVSIIICVVFGFISYSMFNYILRNEIVLTFVDKMLKIKKQ